MHIGCLQGVLYLGPVGCTEWLHDQLITTYWIAPSLNMAVMLRSNTDCSLAKVNRMVTHHMQRMSNNIMTLPILTFKGTQDLQTDRLSQCTTGDTFLIHDQAIPELFKDHSSFLWECGVCGKCASKRTNLTTRANCTNGKAHTICFDDILTVKSWGSHMDRKKSPYGCPHGHTGTGTQSTLQDQPQQTHQPLQEQPQLPPMPQSSPARSSPAPTPPSTPIKMSGSHRYEEVVEQFVSPRSGPKARLPASIPRTSGATQPVLSGGSRVQGSEQTAPSSSSTSRSRRRMGKPQPKYTCDESEEDSDDSDLDADYLPESGSVEEKEQVSDESSVDSEEDDEESEEPTETADESAMPDTDDESDDDDNIRIARRQNRGIFREKMREVNKKDGNTWSSPDVWDCQCEKCQWVMSQLIVRPRIEMSTRWNSLKNEAPPEVKEMVKSGKLPREGTKFKKQWKDIATTPILYAKGLRYFLAQYQKELQQSRANREKLDNGMLHIWQMLEFQEWNQISFPENPMPLVEKIASPSMQKMAWCGYKQLVDSSILWLSKLEAVDKFFIETTRMDGEEDKEYFTRVKENEVKAKDTRLKEGDYLRRIVDDMKKDKPWAKMEGTAAWRKEQKERFAMEFSGQAEVDSNCVTRYLNHPLVINFFDELLEIASQEEVVSGHKMVNITKQLLPITHIKQAHREEIWKKMTLRHWNDAVTGPDCAYPYVDPRDVDMEVARHRGRVHVGHRAGFLDNEEIYVREDLHSPDPLVQDDPLRPGQEGDNRELLLGKATVVNEHKTGRKYPAYIWFSQYDVVYLRAYESIRHRYLQSIGKNGSDLSTVFFINSKGEAYLTSGQPMDWTWFRNINQCGNFTGHKARKIFSDYIKNKKDAVMSEAREYTMCNSNTVDKEHYQSQLRKKSIAMMTIATYRRDLAAEVETGVRSHSDVPYFSTEQRERERQGRVLADKEYREKYFEMEETMLVRVQPTLRRLITPNVRKAVVDCLIECKNRYITSKGNMVDCFMKGDNVHSRRCAKLLLRMIFMLPEELACVKHIKENMLVFAKLSEEESNIRKLEWDYTWKLLNLIKNIKDRGSIESAALIYSLAKLNKAAWEEGNFLGYSFGNANLRLSIELMLSQQQSKKSELLADASKHTSKEAFMLARREKTAAYLKKRKEERDAELDEPLEDVPLEDVPREDVTLEVAGKDQGKVWDRLGRVTWTDVMKIELLRLWISKVPNPMVRSTTLSGKGPFKNQLKPLLQNGVTMLVDGENYILSTMSEADTLAQFLQGVQKKGLSKQKAKAAGTGGLVHIIDEWLEGKDDRSIDYVRSSCEEIINYARETYC